MSHWLNDYSLYRVLAVFFDDPVKDFQLREISRKIKLHHKTVLRQMKKLLKMKLVKENRKTLYKSYNSNTENPWFARTKRTFNLLQLYDSGLIDFLQEKVQPGAITVFGSYAKGVDTKESDIDLFLEAPEENLEVSLYEEKLGRKVHLFFEKNFHSLNSGLKNNLLNGTILQGSLKVFK